MSWSVDGYEWSIPCTIERVAEVESSDISGMMMNKQYFNDVLGTWMKYTVTIAIPKGYEQEYTDLYEMLTNPVDAHEFVLPYNESVINVTARVRTVSDRYVRLPGNKQTWRRTTFDIIANHPSKEMDLQDVINHGITPMPEVEATDGDLFEYQSGGWIQRFWPSGDEEFY